MSIIVPIGIPIPTSFVVPDSLATALPKPQIRIPRRAQRQDVWCYAACAQMVIKYCTGKTVQQCEIASFVKNGTDCCPPTKSVCVRRGCTKEQVKEIFVHWNVPHKDPKTMLNLNQIKDDIEDDCVIEAIIDWRTTDGEASSSHAVLITGVLDTMVYVIDPLRPAEYNDWNSHDHVRRGFGKGRWERSFREMK